RARYATNAAAREMADRQRGLEGGPHRDRARGGRLRLRGFELDSASPRAANDIFVAKALGLSSRAHPRAELPLALHSRVSVVSRASRAGGPYDRSRRSRRRGLARWRLVAL